jgi:hypothetical protein
LVKLVFQYGSNSGRDIDLFVILRGKAKYNCIHQTQLDITYVGDHWVDEMLACFDPLITEPIITGRVIFGEGEEHFQKRLSESRPTEKSVEYLRDKAIQFLEWAKNHYQSGNFSESSNCLRFAISFYLFSEYYTRNLKPITFAALIDKNNCNLLQRAEKIAKGALPPLTEDLIDLINNTEETLTKREESR